LLALCTVAVMAHDPFDLMSGIQFYDRGVLGLQVTIYKPDQGKKEIGDLFRNKNALNEYVQKYVHLISEIVGTKCVKSYVNKTDYLKQYTDANKAIKSETKKLKDETHAVDISLICQFADYESASELWTSLQTANYVFADNDNSAQDEGLTSATEYMPIKSIRMTQWTYNQVSPWGIREKNQGSNILIGIEVASIVVLLIALFLAMRKVEVTTAAPSIPMQQL